jgi:1-acyl-sn-glycerol-3-phosphate acyltransferase
MSRLENKVKRWLDEQIGQELLQKLMAVPTRQNEYGYDAFGFNRDEAKVAVVFTRWLYRYYFRVKTFGVENIPPGRALILSNHSGQLPFDGVSIGGALIFDLDPPRIARSMIEHFVPSLPYVSYLFSRWGQIVGTPENCLRLLRDDEVVVVFPEGARGVSKPFSQRYKLQSFGHGFMRLALETGAPIIPTAVIGAEEQAPSLNVSWLAKLFRVPAFPLMPFPPFFPALPLPTKYRIHFGAPMHFEGDPDGDDDELQPMVEEVRKTIQSMIHMGLKKRKHVFW